MAVRSAAMNVMQAAAKKASRGLLRDYGEVDQLQVSRKGPADYVTAADRKVDEILRETLSKARPGFGFLTEELGETKGDDPDSRFIIDPIDGTTNFIHGIPHFCISIALEQRGELVAGVIYEPLRDEMFWAEKGAGAWLNERRLRVSARGQMIDAVFATGTPPRTNHDGDKRTAYLREVNAVLAVSAGIRRFGSAALDLAYVAAGRVEGYWEHNLSAWDIAAGIVLVREAGGFISEVGGGANMLKSGNVLACNDRLFDSFGQLVRSAAKKD